MNSKPAIFIGSSSEGLVVAGRLKSIFDDQAEVDIWNSGEVFTRNQSFFGSLLDAAGLYDFAVLIFSCDDLSQIRGESYNTARDNIVFEFGLFHGKLGPRRAFALVEKDIKLPSDLLGISLDSFTRDEMGMPTPDFENIGKDLLERILTYHRESTEFYQLPSTALAIGYFHNFLAKVCDRLDDYEPVIIGGSTITYESFSLNILIPDRLELLDDVNLRSVYRKLTRVTVNNSKFRDFPFFVRGMPSEGQGHLELFDIPTTLCASREAIQRIFQEDYIGKGSLRSRAEVREVRNFERTLRLLLEERPFWQKYIEFPSLLDFIP